MRTNSWLVLVLSILGIVSTSSALRALEPTQVLVIANEAMPESVAVARHYLKVRSVPETNLLLVKLPTSERMERADYDQQLARPVRAYLEANPGKIRCLLTVYGVPLMIGRQQPTEAEAAEWAKLKLQRDQLRDQLTQLEQANPKDQPAIDRVRSQIKPLDEADYKLNHAETEAATDSELMLVLQAPYPLYRVLPNPLYRFMPEDKQKALGPKTMITCRLDGPTPEIAKRLVEDAVAVEAAGGLKGKAYMDARGLVYDAANPAHHVGYEGYDESFREAATILKQAGFDVTLDNEPAVFTKDSCPEAALYAGWYSVANFVPSNQFVRGSIAWHLASYELTSMRTEGKLWVPNLLKTGACVSIGPVAEPYTVAFPKPAEFFALLATGNYTVAECYAQSVYFASWMNVLVADPLYNPFRGQARYDETKVEPSPRGMPSLFK